MKFSTSEGFTGRRSYVNCRIEELRIKTLYGCATCSVTLMEKRMERLYENSVLRKVFESKKNEVTGAWKKLHREVYDLHYSRNIRVIE